MIFLFTHLKKHLSGQRFSNKEEVETEVENYFNQQPPAFYENAFNDLVVRWQKCIDANGSYIEK